MVQLFIKANFTITVVEIMLRFVQETSLHGWKYLSQESKPILKLAWSVILFSASIASIYFMFYYTNQFVAATTVTTIDSTIAPIMVM